MEQSSIPDNLVSPPYAPRPSATINITSSLWRCSVRGNPIPSLFLFHPCFVFIRPCVEFHCHSYAFKSVYLQFFSRPTQLILLHSAGTLSPLLSVSLPVYPCLSHSLSQCLSIRYVGYIVTVQKTSLDIMSLNSLFFARALRSLSLSNRLHALAKCQPQTNLWCFWFTTAFVFTHFFGQLPFLKGFRNATFR